MAVQFADSRAASPSGDVRRRDFINIAAVSSAAVGGVLALWPLIDSLNPSADVMAVASVDVDLAPIEVGQAIKVKWRGSPVFIRHLTPAEQEAARRVPLAQLRDPQTLEDRTKEGYRNWLIVIGICTHLGCVPLGVGETEPRGDYGGYFCPCHGSHYDTAARIRRGPAPRNLAVPDYLFKTPTQVQIG